MKHKITFELRDDKQLQKLREHVEPNVLTEESLEPLFHALEEYQPPVEPLQVGDNHLYKSYESIPITAVTPKAACLELADGSLWVFERAEYPDGLTVIRDNKEVLAPWPEASSNDE